MSLSRLSSSYEMGRRAIKQVGEKGGNPREKPAVTPASRTWLASHVASAGLEHRIETTLNSCTSTTPQDLLYWENSTQ